MYICKSTLLPAEDTCINEAGNNQSKGPAWVVIEIAATEPWPYSYKATLAHSQANTGLWLVQQKLESGHLVCSWMIFADLHVCDDSAASL